MLMLNPIYFMFALPALILGLYAQFKVQSAYARYLKTRNSKGIVGHEAARHLLAATGLGSVRIAETRGQLTDHYDPRDKTLYLSEGVARTPSVAALGIVAHEVGHAQQDMQGYSLLKLRGAMVPAVQIGSWLGPILFVMGLVLQLGNLPEIGLILFSTTLLFALVTLPVEFNASRRAVGLLKDTGLVTTAEEKGVRQVLSAAALTYVAAAVQALSTIMYYLFILGGRQRD